MNNLALFVDMCQVNQNIPKLAAEFTHDIDGLLITLKENYSHRRDKKTKKKFNFIRKTLENTLAAPASHDNPVNQKEPAPPRRNATLKKKTSQEPRSAPSKNTY